MILACKNIKKSFIIDEVLSNINFQLEQSEKVALVGINGAGKSTLFKIITNELIPDEGNVILSNNVEIGYLSQHMDLNSSNTILDEIMTVFHNIINLENQIRELEHKMNNVPDNELTLIMNKYSMLQHKYEELNGYGYKSQIKGVLKGLGFNENEFEQPINQLSGGQKTRICLAKLLLNTPSILLLDEPTNHLDIQAVEWLESFLKNYKGAVIIISHDRYFLDKIVTKVIEIEHGKSKVYYGNYSYYAKQKVINHELELKHFLEQQKEIKKQEEIIRELRSFNREKSVKRARSREKMLTKIEKLEKPQQVDNEIQLTLNPKITSGNDVVHVEKLKKSFNNIPLFENINFDIKRSEKIALIGSNGIGKTTLFKILMNEFDYDEGLIHLGSKVNIGYYDQEQNNLSPNKTIFDEISDAYPSMTNVEIRNVLAAFLFKGNDVFKKINNLSGGEKGRVSLAKIMLSKSNFLLLDEPTNHLDITSKEILETAINNYTGTVLYVSHDRYFINKTADAVFELTPNKIITYLGNYDDYLEKKRQLILLKEKRNMNNKSNAKTKNITHSKEKWLKQKNREAELRKQQNQIEKIEKNITKIENELDIIDNLLCLEENYTDPKKANELHNKKIKLEKNLEQLYEEWEQINN